MDQSVPLPSLHMTEPDGLSLERLQATLDVSQDHWVTLNFRHQPTNLPQVRQTLAALETMLQSLALAHLVANLETRTVQASSVGESDVKRLKEQVRFEVGRIFVEHLSINSPLQLAMMIPAGVLTAITGAFVFLLKNPEKLGSWWPRVQTGYYKAEREKLKAQRALARLQRAAPEGHVEVGSGEARPPLVLPADGPELGGDSPA
ncbi:hypothetical protein GCM10027176_51620 [Actinoallomurus bryophytorum]